MGTVKKLQKNHVKKWKLDYKRGDIMAKKINISIDDELLTRLDNFADSNYLSRSGLVSIAINNYLTQKEAITAVKKLAIAFEHISATGNLDDETLKQLSDFSKFANFFVQNT